jgi:hypothetical protein
MSSDEFAKSLEDAQWEAEYGENRLKLILEEERRLRADQEDCFPKTEPWTVFINRPDNLRGILVRFSDKGEAYSYAVSILRNDSDDVYLDQPRGLEQIYASTRIYNVGQTDSMQVAMFSGIKVPSSILDFPCGFYLMNPTHALKLGQESLIEYKDETAKIIEVPLTVKNLDHWTECLSEKARSYLT